MNELLENTIKKNTYYKAKLSNFVAEEELNIRDDYGDIESLAQSIMTFGQLTPLLAYQKDGYFHLIDGFRRHRAFKFIKENHGLDLDISVTVAPRGFNLSDRMSAMIIRNEVKQLNNYELLEVVSKMSKEQRRSEKDIVKSLNLTSNKTLMKLLELPKEIRTDVQKRTLPLSLALKIVDKHKNLSTHVLENAKKEHSKIKPEHVGIDQVKDIVEYRTEKSTYPSMKHFLESNESVAEIYKNNQLIGNINLNNP